MFEFDNKNNLIIIFVVLAIVLFFTNGRMDLEDLLLYLPGLITALTLHEFAHAWMAVKLGDPTPEAQGRLNINPLSHMDPIGTICLLFGGFGWGKPVQINPTHFKHPEKDSAKVAFAGPAMNLILTILFAMIYALALVIGFRQGYIGLYDGQFGYTSTYRVIIEIILNAMYLNLGLALFNLLPFPPLDGSKIYRAFTKGKVKELLYNLEQYSMIIIMILFVTHIASYIINPIMNAIIRYVLEPIVEGILHIAG